MRAAASRPAPMAATRSRLAAPPARRGRPRATVCAAAAPPTPTAPPARAARLCKTRESASWSVSTAQHADWPRLPGARGSPRHDLARATPARGARDYPSCDWLGLARLLTCGSPPRSSAISLTYCARDGSRARVRAAACRRLGSGFRRGQG